MEPGDGVVISRGDNGDLMVHPMKKKRGILNMILFRWGKNIDWMPKHGASMDPHQDIQTNNPICDVCGYTVRDRLHDRLQSVNKYACI